MTMTMKPTKRKETMEIIITTKTKTTTTITTDTDTDTDTELPTPIKVKAIKKKATKSKSKSKSSRNILASLRRRISSLNRYQQEQKTPKLLLLSSLPQRIEREKQEKAETERETETKTKTRKQKEVSRASSILLSSSSSSSSSLSSSLVLSLSLSSPSPSKLSLATAVNSAARLRFRSRWSLSEIATVAIVYLAAITSCVMPMANGLVNCPIGCSCDDDALVVKCSEGALDVLPITLNPFTQRLVITNNKKIRTIDSSITFYAELTYLDLSMNQLVNIPARTFASQKKLQELNLSHNKIGQINNETFVGLSLVNVLNLRGNLIAELGPNTFGTINKIEELNLGENRINTIDSHAFDGLINLRVLYLDDNTLTTVPAATTFEAMPNLAELFLGTNSFESLPSGIFQHVKGLTRLDLRSAGLVHNISTDALIGLDGLRSLDLSDNRLQQIPTDALNHLQRLEELSLGQNDFDIILPDAFAGLKNLRHLEISGAQRLQRITNGAFAENTNLEYLNFSGNKMLSIIEENALRGLPHLRHVILRENQLSTLAEGLFPWTDLETLDLTDNPFVCNCHIVWLRNLLASSSSSVSSSVSVSASASAVPLNNTTGNISSDLNPSIGIGANRIANVICVYPEQFHGRPLGQLSPTDLGCSHISSNNQALISLLIVGVTVVISALVFIIYGCRQRIRETLKGGWGNSALGRKEREYQKTFSDEEYMTRQQHPCLGLGMPPTISTTPYAGSDHHQHHQHHHHNQHHQHHNNANFNPHSPAYMGSRPIPVTEL